MDPHERFKGSEQAKNCAFCALLEGVTGDKTLIAGSGEATAIVSKKDGHPLFMPLLHIEGQETDHRSELARKATNEWLEILLPHIRSVYEQLYGATGFTIKANLGTQQNISHYHVHGEAWKGPKDSEQILITDPAERFRFAEAIRRSVDPAGLAIMSPEPTHW